MKFVLVDNKHLKSYYEITIPKNSLNFTDWKSTLIDFNLCVNLLVTSVTKIIQDDGQSTFAERVK